MAKSKRSKIMSLGLPHSVFRSRVVRYVKLNPGLKVVTQKPSKGTGNRPLYVAIKRKKGKK